MSTNKSEHLSLHLWEPVDDFLRTEFNENFEAIDRMCGTILTPAGEVSACGAFEISGETEAGNTLLSLDFVPRYIILGVETLHLVVNGSLGTINIKSGATTYDVSFSLRENNLVVAKVDSRISIKYKVQYVAVP